VRPIPPAVEALAEAVCAAARRLAPDGLTVATAGNISTRDPGSGLIAVTPSGFPYESMTPAEIAIVDPVGRTVRAPHRPTSELALHVLTYARFNAVHAVVHPHSPYATAFAVLRRPIPLISNEGANVGALRVEVTEFASPGTVDLGRAAMALLERAPRTRAFLLANHGAVALAKDLGAAYRLAASVEWEARIYHHALAIGEPILLDQAQMDEIVTHYSDLPPLERSPWGDE
jgi:L-fuculose-phosphate aldolase